VSNAALIAVLFLGLYLYASIKAEEGSTLTNVAPDDRIRAIAEAINKIENGGDPNGGRRNNPGNIVDTITKEIKVFATPAEGWQALYNKLNIDFVEATSRVYSPNMTWREVAWMWVNGTGVGVAITHPGDSPDAWAAVVASELSVGMDSTVAEYLA
jgi:hypothetical protein